MSPPVLLSSPPRHILPPILTRGSVPFINRTMFPRCRTMIISENTPATSTSGHNCGHVILRINMQPRMPSGSLPPQPRHRRHKHHRPRHRRQRNIPVHHQHEQKERPPRECRQPGRDRRPARPKITQKDIPRLYPPGSEIIVQVTKGPIGTKGPRITTNLVLPGRFLVLLPNADQSGISRKIENQEERRRLKKILRELAIPDGMGVIMRTAGEGQQKRYFIRDLALLLEEWNGVLERRKKKPPATCMFQEPDLIKRTVRDLQTEDVERIVVDNQKAHDRMREMVARISKRAAEQGETLHRRPADF